MKNKEIIKPILLIPAYKPDNTLLKLIEHLIKSDKHNVFNSIIIVDDGSGAEYKTIFDALSKIEQVTILYHAINLGKGAALKTGFSYISLKNKDLPIITADADGQHKPSDILNIAQQSIVMPNKLILGIRKFRGKIPFRSLIGNLLTRFIIRFLTGLNLTDTQTGLRAWPSKLALKSLKIPINGYDFETEALVRAPSLLENKAAIAQIPIQTVYENNNKGSHFNPLLDSMRIYFVFIRYCGAGLVTALVDNIVFITLFSIFGDIVLSQVASRSGGALVSFYLSKNIIFRSHANWSYALIKFFFLVVLLGLISYMMINVLITSFNMNVIAAKILAELILFIASFSIQRHFIF